MIQKYWDRGEPAPIAVSFGHHPLLQLVAGMEVPAGVSEYEYAGNFINSSYQTVEGPVTGLPLPADSELAIEGYVHQETCAEGPFGEFLGYYASGTTQSPIVKVEAIYHRDDPIILGMCVGKPPHDSVYFRCPLRAAFIWDVLEKAGVQMDMETGKPIVPGEGDSEPRPLREEELKSLSAFRDFVDTLDLEGLGKEEKEKEENVSDGEPEEEPS